VSHAHILRVILHAKSKSSQSFKQNISLITANTFHRDEKKKKKKTMKKGKVFKSKGLIFFNTKDWNNE